MRRAIEAARRGMAAGEPPVGACLVHGDQILAACHNSIISTLDVTAHAEIMAIREACISLRSLELSGCELYVTLQPCPMCLAACHYAGIGHLIFGARLDDMDAVTQNELRVAPSVLFGEGGSSTEVTGDFLRDECRALLLDWAGSGR